MSQPRPSPRASYRLQLNQDLPFAAARELVPYLNALGVSHLYSSPCLKTRAGSSHGYDIIDHNSFNPELGDEAEFDRLVEALRANDMGLLLDIVPNHMGVGSDNAWWMDVLEHGEASQYARYFDIDWNPNNRLLRGKLLLPVLGDYYGEVLERKELQLAFDEKAGSFHVSYFEHRFPIDPRTYVHVLAWHLDELAREVGDEDVLGELQALIQHFRALPRRSNVSHFRKQQRQEAAEEGKLALATLCARRPALVDWLQGIVAQINGQAGVSTSFERLHRLLQSQAYRLAYWKVAADEINYRRFFDINDLAGLRMEDEGVFQTTHRLIASLAMQGRIDGVRIDHVDGLADPATYCARLQRLLNSHQEGHCWIYLEKILARDEELRDWPVQGTTGYEFGALANGLFVVSEAEQALSALYDQFALAGHSAVLAVPAESRVVVDFAELLYHSKRFITQYALSGELSVLTNLLSRLAQADRHTRDFTYNSLRSAITEVVACFPVYRTYVTPKRIEAADRTYLAEAVKRARERKRVEPQVLDFVHRILTVTPRVLDRDREGRTPELRRHMAAFCQRFQQYTSMVEAKGLEDTAGYRYHRLISLNEVGADPCQFGIDVDTFHEANRRRQEKWPQAMLSTSTHDSKRSEDLRMRLDVLSEVPDEWSRHVLHWRELNRGHKRQVDEQELPSANDEYLLYQTLFGAWPLEPEDEGGLENFHSRLADFMLKAVREAKLYTSWANPDEDYEGALAAFVEAVVSSAAFLDDFLPFLQRYSRYGLLNALSQTLLKLTVPGVPDIYQGNELFVFNMVDPDNRRPVDFALRRRQLEELQALAAGERHALLRDLQSALADGRAKLFLTWSCLQLRRELPEVFSAGEYLPLVVEGALAEHLIAYVRRHEERCVLVVACRWFARLDRRDRLADGQIDWQDTRVLLPAELCASGWRDVLLNSAVGERGSAESLPASALFASFPLCLWSL